MLTPFNFNILITVCDRCYSNFKSSECPTREENPVSNFGLIIQAAVVFRTACKTIGPYVMVESPNFALTVKTFFTFTISGGIEDEAML